jgi:hypothetical protein
MEAGNLYDRPDLYDLLAPRDPAIEEFYVEGALMRDGPVLDLACGSGRLSIPLPTLEGRLWVDRMTQISTSHGIGRAKRNGTSGSRRWSCGSSSRMSCRR